MKKIGMILIVCFIFPIFLISSQEFTTVDKWYSYDDIKDGGSSKVSMTLVEETIGGKSYFVATMTGKVTTKFQYGFIGFGYKPEGEDLARLKAATGIKFKVLGDGKSYAFRGETTIVKDSCYHQKVFSTKKGQVVEVYIPYNTLKQQSWGKATGAFRKEKLWQISFQTVGQPHSNISIKVFDFQIVK